MAGRDDKPNGCAEQEAGDLTGDDEKQREGQADEAPGDVKEFVDKAADKVDEAVDRQLRGDESR